MGCCFSKKESSRNPHSPSTTHPQKRHFQAEIPAWGSDPRLNVPLEEETVKEVLSETPKPCPPKIAEDEKKKIQEEEEKVTIDEKKNQEEEKIIINGDKDEIFEEVSEIYSLSESVSTTTVTEKREDSNEIEVDQVKNKVTKIPASGSAPGRKRERDREEIRRRISPSPVRRRDPLPGGSPVKTAGKTVPGKNVGQMDRRRQVVQPAGKRVPGEVGNRDNVRRSRSPVTRADSGVRTNGVRSSSSTRGQSPGRIPAEESPEDGRKVVDEKDLPEGSSAETNNESLENPLVSLECFIFL